MTKLIKGNVFVLLNTLNSLGEIKESPEFSYFVAKNKKLLGDEAEVLKTVINNVSEKYKEFDQKRISMNTQYAKKDDNGEPIINNNAYVIADENRGIFNEELNKLREEYKEVLLDEEKRQLDINKLLNEKIDIDLYKIKLNKIPTGVSGNNLEKIIELVEE